MRPHALLALGLLVALTGLGCLVTGVCPTGSAGAASCCTHPDGGDCCCATGDERAPASEHPARSAPSVAASALAVATVAAPVPNPRLAAPADAPDAFLTGIPLYLRAHAWRC